MSNRYGTKESDLDVVAQMADSDYVRVLIGDVPARITLTNIATELESLLASSSTSTVIRSVSSGTTLTTDDNVLLVDSTSGAITITLPSPSDAFDSSTSLSNHFTISQKISNSNLVTIQPNGSENIYSSGSAQTSIVLSNGSSISVVSDGTDWTVISE